MDNNILIKGQETPEEKYDKDFDKYRDYSDGKSSLRTSGQSGAPYYESRASKHSIPYNGDGVISVAHLIQKDGFQTNYTVSTNQLTTPESSIYTQHTNGLSFNEEYHRKMAEMEHGLVHRCKHDVEYTPEISIKNNQHGQIEISQNHPMHKNQFSKREKNGISDSTTTADGDSRSRMSSSNTHVDTRQGESTSYFGSNTENESEFSKNQTENSSRNSKLQFEKRQKLAHVHLAESDRHHTPNDKYLNYSDNEYGKENQQISDRLRRL
jgi:hypothetical protein